MNIKCGTCGGRHETVAAIRECSGVRVTAGGEAERYLRNQESMADGERAAAAWAGPDRETERMATPKMVKYVDDILRSKVVPPEVADVIGEYAGTYTLTFQTARKFIDRYKDAPKRSSQRRPGGPWADLVDGVYRNPADGAIFKIYHTVHGANEQVAKRLKVLEESERFTKVVRGKEVEVKAEFVYEGKRGLEGLTPEMRMTLEDAKKYGAIYGVCVRCSATLTKEESIERSMGSTCASKANWA